MFVTFVFFIIIRRCILIGKQSSGFMVNEKIKFRDVRLIDSNGEMIGVVGIAEARRRANDQGLDLVLISPSQDNPVCKIMDYGKFLFEQSKREREAKKNQKVTEVKEVQLKISTEEHDLAVKTRNACRFLENEDRVKVVVKFRGREMAYTSKGFEVMNEFFEACSELGVIDRAPRMEGRNMVMYLAPKK